MGFILAILSALLATSKDVVSKKLAYGVDGTLSAFASFFYALPFYLVLLAILYLFGLEDFAFSTTFFTLVFLRALADCGTELCKMHALTHCDLSIASCLMSLSLAFLLLLSPIITGDVPSSLGVIGVCLTIVGNILLVYRPGGKLSKTDTKGIMLALAAAFFLGLNACFDRLAVQVASPALSGFSMTALSCVFLCLPMLRRTTKFKGLLESKRYFSIRGVFEVGYMVIKLWALQYLQAPYVGGIGKLSLIFSIVGGKVIFKEKEFIKKILCGVLIITGAVLIIIAETSS